jgi:mannitol 2-dehydrogenase
MSVALAARSRPVTWLEQHDTYGDLGTEPAFVRAFTEALNAIWEDGTEAVLTRYIAT